MQMAGLKTNVMAGAALALAFTFAAQAQNSRSFVATTGNDANNCSVAAYCRTFGKALSQTNQGGEIVVVNSGGYTQATISQAVTITAVGVDASISVPSSTGGVGLIINTPGNVTITGLNVYGNGAGGSGIVVEAVGALRLYNMLINGFNGFGVSASAGVLSIYGSSLNDNVLGGLAVENASAYVQDSSFSGNVAGVQALGSAQIVVVNSSAEQNTYEFRTDGGSITLFNDRATFNGYGLYTNGGTLYFADCLITGNTVDSYNKAFGTMAGTSPGTTIVTPGQASSGTLGTAITLK